MSSRFSAQSAAPTYTTYRRFLTSLISELALAQPPSSEQSSNPLLSQSGDIKNILLSIHALFPNELLPALDILDRRLATRISNVQAIRHPPSQEDRYPTGSSRLDGSDPATITSPNPSLGADRGISRHVQDQALPAARSLDSEQDENAPTHSLSQGAGDIPRDVHEGVHGLAMAAVSDVYYVQSGRQQTTSRDKWRDATSETTAYYEVRLVPWSCSCPAFTFSAFPAIQPARNLVRQDTWQIGGRSLGDDIPICKHILACALGSTCLKFETYVQRKSMSQDEIAGWAAGYSD